MTTSNNCSVLKDVVAYVDVWSSDKTANYSEPFVQQLQEMGAQVSKRFNKQVTHVVFNNGHQATWRKAKKSHVRLVSVLWVGRCHDDGVRVDEELFPALNDESNPVLMNKRHRCMQPKDSPERTPENDRRMRKKLDKMMKDLAPKQPLVTDVSPIIIDEENGIVYSPALKRSDYMAQRLKDMKEKRENLSPTASEIAESCSPTGLKPSLGSTPTVFKLIYEQSDDNSSASVAEPAYSPDKEEGRTHTDVTDLDEHHRKDPKKPWLSLCHDVEGTGQKKSRRTSVRQKPAEKHKSVGLLESPCEDGRSDNGKDFHKEKRRSQIKSSSHSGKGKGKGKMKAAKSSTETKTHFCSDAVNSSSCLSSPAKLGDTALELSKEAATLLQKTKGARPSLSAFVQYLTEPGDSKNVASSSTDGDDKVFKDYFSQTNHLPRSKRPPSPKLPVERDIQFPFELESVPRKRKLRSESIESKTNSKRWKILEKSQQTGASSEPQSHPQQDVKESLPALDGADVTLMAKRRRQSMLPFTSTGSTTSDAVKRRRASTSVQPTMPSEANAVSELQQNSFSVSHTLESV